MCTSEKQFKLSPDSIKMCTWNMWIFMVTNSESLEVSIYKFVYEKKINWQCSLFTGYSCCA